MTEQEILERMVQASKEDRERFFQVADTLHLQPKFQDKLTEIETIKQQWRDMTKLPNYPQIVFPLSLPEWFPTVRFASCWDSDYLVKKLSEEKRLSVD